MADKSSIQRELDQNLEAYTRNKLLNKLTPTRTRYPKRTAKDDANILLSTTSSSLKRATSNSHAAGSRKVTPRKAQVNGKFNDSTIVTSPVKTLRRHASNNEDSSSDEFEPTTTFDQRTRTTLQAATVPLNDKSKSPLRKGTPKLKKISDKSVVKDDSKLILDGLKSRSFNGSRRLLHDDLDDEFDDYDTKKANETLLDDIPADLLSPEKHRYPTENLTRSSIDSYIETSSSKKQRTQKKSIYPTLPPTADLLKSSVSKSPTIRFSRSPSVDLLKSSQSPEQPIKDTPKAPVSSNLISSSIQRPIGRSTSKPSSRPSSKPTSKAASKQPSLNSTPIEKANKSNTSNILSLFKPDSSYKPPSASKIPIYATHLQSNPFRDHNPILDKSSPVLDKRSPARRISQPTNESVRSNVDEERLDEPRSTISRYESDEEELHVPEMTSTKFGELLDPNEIKRKHAEIEIFEDEREVAMKRQRLYPDLTLVNDKKIEVHGEIMINQKEAAVTEQNLTKSSLYPNLKRYDSEVSKKEEVLPPIKASSSLKRKRSREDEELGDSDHWTRSQWTRFFKTYKKYTENNNDLSVFAPSVLIYLRCGIEEIKSKIRFVVQYEDEVKYGLKKDY